MRGDFSIKWAVMKEMREAEICVGREIYVYTVKTLFSGCNGITGNGVDSLKQKKIQYLYCIEKRSTTESIEDKGMDTVSDVNDSPRKKK